jgi:TolB-like protein
VDARNDNLIWTDSYDRDLTDIFAVQSEIARQIAAKLSARFNTESSKRKQE